MVGKTSSITWCGHRQRHTWLPLYCCNQSAPYSILCSSPGLYISFRNHLVIKVQIVLPPLLSIHMVWWEYGGFLQPLIYEVMAPVRVSGVLLRCCSPSFISLICSGFQENYHSSRWQQFVWHDSCCRILCTASRWPRVKSMARVQQRRRLSDGISCCSFVTVGLVKSRGIDLPFPAK